MKIEKVLKLWGNKPFTEAKKLLCGKKIGSGSYRNVYVLKQNPLYVVKIEKPDKHGIFANAAEWLNWQNNKGWNQVGPWMAPCETISYCGRILIQVRVEHRDKKEYPKKVPAVFTDRKYSNFGWRLDNGKFVCCDYSFLVMATKPELVPAKWWKP